MSANKTETLEQELARLRAENETLKATRAKGYSLRCKVSEKGALSVYGLGQWPTTLYREQWEALLDYSDAIRKALTLPGLKSKGDAKPEAPANSKQASGF